MSQPQNVGLLEARIEYTVMGDVDIQSNHSEIDIQHGYNIT